MLYGTQNPHGGDVYTRPIELDFSANINPLGTPEGVFQAVRESLKDLSHYPDPYCRDLTEAICRHEGVPQHYVLCGNGAAELIFAFCFALKPKKALVPAPTFCEYENGLTAVGCQVEHFYLKESRDFALGEDFLACLRETDAEVLMLCNPNNPTGLVIAPDLMEKICETCQERGIRLFLDSCFLDLTEGGETDPMTGKLETYRNLLILKAFTKSYGMAGLRLGYCLSADQALLTAMSSQTQPWNVSIPAQRAGVAALREKAFLERACKIIHTQRPVLLAALTRLGFRVIPSRTNYILFHSERELAAPLLEKGIQIRSCDNYPGLSQGWYRIAVKGPEENEKLIHAMEEIVYG